MSTENDSTRNDLEPELASYFERLQAEALAGPAVEPSAAVSEFVTGSVGPPPAAFDVDADVTEVQPFAAPEGPGRRWPLALVAAAISVVVAIGVTVAVWPAGTPEVEVATVAANAQTDGDAASSVSEELPTTVPPTTAAPTTAPAPTVAETGDLELDDAWPFGDWPELDEAIVVCDEQLTVIPDPDTDDPTPPLPPFEELREALERCHEELRNALGEDFPAFELPPFDLDELDIPELFPPDLLPPELFDGEGFLFELPEGEGFRFTPDGDGFRFELEPIDPEELERWFDGVEPHLDDWLGELEPEIDRWFDEFEPELEKEFDEFEPELDKWFEDMDPELQEWLDRFDREFDDWYGDWPEQLDEPVSA